MAVDSKSCEIWLGQTNQWAKFEFWTEIGNVFVSCLIDETRDPKLAKATHILLWALVVGSAAS